MTSPCQDPTPEQEAIYELHSEIAALKEQIVEAYRLLTDSNIIFPNDYTPKQEWLDQNESIVKECAK